MERVGWKRLNKYCMCGRERERGNERLSSQRCSIESCCHAECCHMMSGKQSNLKLE